MHCLCCFSNRFTTSPEGRRATIVVREGDDVNASVHKFFAIYNTSLEIEADFAPNVTRDIEQDIAKREVRSGVLKRNMYPENVDIILAMLLPFVYGSQSREVACILHVVIAIVMTMPLMMTHILQPPEHYRRSG